jgi:hypothetical protein
MKKTYMTKKDLVAKLAEAYGPFEVEPRSCPQWQIEGFHFYVSEFEERATVWIGHQSLNSTWFTIQKTMEGRLTAIYYAALDNVMAVENYISDGKKILGLMRHSLWSNL